MEDVVWLNSKRNVDQQTTYLHGQADDAKNVMLIRRG